MDPTESLHLKIASSAGTWTCAEIIGPTSYGIWDLHFHPASSVGTLDPNVVLGLFTRSDRAQYAHREIDIEFARWGNAADPTNAQYVVQSYARANHLRHFTQPGTTPRRSRSPGAPARSPGRVWIAAGARSPRMPAGARTSRCRPTSAFT